jgi:hypothetical protein
MFKKLLVLLVVAVAGGQSAAWAQRGLRCAPRVALYPAVYFWGAYGQHRSCDGDTIDRPFVPTRWGAFLGVSALANQHAGLGGAEAEATYRVSPRLQAGLAGSAGFPARIGSNLGVTEAAKPMLGLYSLTARANLLLLDNPRLRTALITGAGVGAATLADRSQQVVDKGQQQSCGCEPTTHAKTVASAVGLVGLAGVSATYKLQPELWLTAKAYYQQWAGATGFGSQRALSPWVLSVGISLPDTWK